uniref:Uncharacterized protein n=1 Tax=Lepeophtheirus salmonis TaxID=72036 RepID=A0A0K2V4C6_LEPSM
MSPIVHTLNKPNFVTLIPSGVVFFLVFCFSLNNL